MVPILIVPEERALLRSEPEQENKPIWEEQEWEKCIGMWLSLQRPPPFSVSILGEKPFSLNF